MDISKQQKNFNEILAVATIVLAFGFILNFFKIEVNWQDSIALFILLVLVLVFFIFFIIILTFKAMSYVSENLEKFLKFLKNLKNV